MKLRYYHALFFSLILTYSYSQSSTKPMEKKDATTTNNHKLPKDEFATYTHLSASDTTNLLKNFIDRLNGDWFFDDDLFGKIEVSINLSNKTYQGTTTFHFDSKPQPSMQSKLELREGRIKIITTVSVDEFDIADAKIEDNFLTIKNATNTTVFTRRKN